MFYEMSPLRMSTKKKRFVISTTFRRCIHQTHTHICNDFLQTIAAACIKQKKIIDDVLQHFATAYIKQIENSFIFYNISPLRTLEKEIVFVRSASD